MLCGHECSTTPCGNISNSEDHSLDVLFMATEECEQKSYSHHLDPLPLFECPPDLLDKFVEVDALNRASVNHQNNSNKV